MVEGISVYRSPTVPQTLPLVRQMNRALWSRHHPCFGSLNHWSLPSLVSPGLRPGAEATVVNVIVMPYGEPRHQQTLEGIIPCPVLGNNEKFAVAYGI
jgi:hypothetical protein